MANVERFLYGHQLLVEFPVASGTVIEKGDFVCISSDLVIPVSDVADVGNATDNREAGADLFVGIANSASGSGDTDPVIVDMSTLSVYKLTQETAAAIDVGDAVEIYASADNCEDQQIVEGSTSTIAYCVKDKGASGTSVECVLALNKIFHTVGS